MALYYSGNDGDEKMDHSVPTNNGHASKVETYDAWLQKTKIAYDDSSAHTIRDHLDSLTLMVFGTDVAEHVEYSIHHNLVSLQESDQSATVQIMLRLIDWMC